MLNYNLILHRKRLLILDKQYFISFLFLYQSNDAEFSRCKIKCFFNINPDWSCSFHMKLLLMFVILYWSKYTTIKNPSNPNFLSEGITVAC